MPLVGLTIMAARKSQVKTSRVPKILPARSRKTGRFLSGNGPQKILGNAKSRAGKRGGK